jgi:Domain of unknown function (DUF397)
MQGGGALSEDMKSSPWRKSSFSASGDCLECHIDADEVLLRHSKDPSGPQLRLSLSEWRAFLAGAKAGEMDVSV